MFFIDPHIHMNARTTDDYEAMAAAGVVAVIEPAFWLGQPRTSVDTYIDYLSTIVGWERFRASQFGIKHYCTIGLNSKEANNEALAEAVIRLRAGDSKDATAFAATRTLTAGRLLDMHKALTRKAKAAK
jgi:predicted metal-dependent TIM-barrel fold hydrolase